MSPAEYAGHPRPIKVLHLTPHLGGGVGKALSGLSRLAGDSVTHTVACLETPEKNRFIGGIRENGWEVVVKPDLEWLNARIRDADIFHLEWWNHPATIGVLCRTAPHPMRLVVWSHVSGLNTPIIPASLIRAAHRFIFTSACSYESREAAALKAQFGARLAVVPSCGGYAGLAEPRANAGDAMSVGYIGSLNFSKIHPCYVDYVAQVSLPGFKVRFIGDPDNRTELERQCARLGREGMLEFRGYADDIASELAGINVLAYLLNPEHYGTTENALLEAMAMGIVPVVLDNPAERHIVENGITGLVVRTPKEFASALEWLAKHPGERSRLGARAAESVRARFAPQDSGRLLEGQYRAAMAQDKAAIHFTDIFGSEPADWFLSCQSEPHIFGRDGRVRLPSGCAYRYGLFEKTKGSVFHFHRYYPEDRRLAQWASALELCAIPAVAGASARQA